ncbi:MAG: Ni/Fe-hydrogenase cytochrome b subunit [Candidatus Eisenbacteria bacterium]|uniref:Ni/Fe-hydrogenase cytochrome b subunit n=1 Tax=Eiseniibacteriota bacterium TaxID=2212470 RepID=A0A948RVZ6_UNCEI|nr:Ni/Fe-hydrogenase cytochrome b subunit [Candidatus Eisenbacteria bacterium]MBU1950282.1 Ni/Fe-hydrogenase cytochrome b subunit [Candidatus Eisenbacteria bacterium]MBU2691506.1 Ni/Fe-hydrogenase cytochrome b subunit [Candidatus Eisenbacteria bacterium]
MSGHEIPTPIRKVPYFTKGTLVLFGIMCLGLATFLARFLFGLGAVTNLNDQYPWGLWIAIDVATGVALAAGGFTTAALAEIFHRGKYHVITRPALLTAMLGYTFVAIGVVTDLGRYYNIWHVLLPPFWQGNSVLFEVGMCVMIYLTVLYVEFLPIVVERFVGRVNFPGPFSIFNKIVDLFLKLAGRALQRVLWVFIIAGVVLSCLHQSSLGTLMVIAPYKMHPLWYTSLSPLLFLLSAIAVGFPMVIFESILASRSLKLKPETKVLSSIARYTPIILGTYFIVKIGDITLREAWPYVIEGSLHSFMWSVEMILGVVTPIVLFSIKRVRNSVGGLFTGATLIVLGVVLNRINVFIIAYKPLYAVKPYFPTFWEIIVTAGLACALVLIYRFFVMNLPVISVPEKDLQSASTRVGS